MLKSTIGLIIWLCSSPAFASDSVRSYVQSFERENGVRCVSAGTSDYSYCLNYLCRYERYFHCTNARKALTLTLKLKSINIPGEAPEVTVLSSSVKPGLR